VGANYYIIRIFSEEVRMSKLSIVDVIKSVLSAAAGVQSDKNRQKDFMQGSLPVYLMAGLIFTIVFVSAIILLVRMVTG
jgi:hypothetical protein